MAEQNKSDMILDALQQLLKEKDIRHISVSEIAEKAGNVSSYTRMAMLFQACRSSSALFLNNSCLSDESAQGLALLHQKHLNYLISELKPALTEIISQGISRGEIQFEYPEALAEIVLIVLAVKLDNYIVPSSTEDIDKTLKGLISLLEKGTGLPVGTLEYLSIKNG